MYKVLLGVDFLSSLLGWVFGSLVTVVQSES